MEVGYVYITSALNATIVGHMLNEDALTGIVNFGDAIIDPVYFVYPKGGSYTICSSVTCVNLDHSIMSKLKKIFIIINNIKSELLIEIDVFSNPI